MRTLYEWEHTTMNDLVYYLESNNQPEFYCDIETLKTNTKQIGVKTSQAQAYMYCFICAWTFEDNDYCLLFPNATVFLNLCLEHLGFSKKSKWVNNMFPPNFNHIKLHFFNGEKFDNHFLLQQTLKQDFNVIEKPYAQRMNKEMNNQLTLKEMPKNTALTSRVRTRGNLDIVAVYIENNYGNARISFIDDYPKFAMGLGKCGKILSQRGLLDEQYMKTDGLQYDKFDKEEPMTYEEAKAYAFKVFQTFTDDECTYMFNDGILLLNVVRYYNAIMGEDFDYNQRTATCNVLRIFTHADMGRGKRLNHASWDLQRMIEIETIARGKKVKKLLHFKYSDYTFHGENLFDYFKHYYKGGMCIYNERYLLKKCCFKWGSMDLNSSYPTVMYGKSLPLGNIISHNNQRTTEPIDLEMEKYTTFYELDWEEFNRIIQLVPSTYQKCGLLRYYNSASGSYYITSVGLRNLTDNCHVKGLTTITYESKLVIENRIFTQKDLLAYMYMFKTAGKVMKVTKDTKHPIAVNNNPTNIVLVDGSHILDTTPSKVDSNKRCINSLYGLPAISDTFSRSIVLEDGSLWTDKHGHINQERNILFSLSVTAYALYNLWTPLRCLTPEQIDDALLYQDTDSLYMKKYAMDIIQETMPDIFNPYNLGGWDIEHIGSKFFISNHKKYCFEDDETGLGFRFGGCRADSFNDKLPFDEFVDKYMVVGSRIKNTRSLMNEELIPVIYEGVTEVTQPLPYRQEITEQTIFETLQDIRTIHQWLNQPHDEMAEFDKPTNTKMYIGNYGQYSDSDINGLSHEETDKTIIDFICDFNDFEITLKNLS